MLNSDLERFDRENNKVRVHIVLIGRVQGVAFRYYALNIARRLGVKGWIKNLANGDVEVLIEGKKSAVKQMIDCCREGPSLAIVKNIKIDWQPYTGEFNEFQIRS